MTTAVTLLAYHRTTMFCAIFLIVFLVGVADASDQEKFFEDHIRPILSEHCIDCHGADEASGELRLDSKAGWERGGERGPAIVPGSPSKSLIIRAINHGDPKLKMPPEDSSQLTEKQIAQIVLWIRQGAFDPRDGTVIKEVDKRAKDHWAFQPLTKTKRHDQSKNPIDELIDRKLEKKKFTVATRANNRTLARRASYDLIGLPPTAKQILLANESYDAFIDELLKSPQYGERWGRHWLDVARYSDAKDGVLMYGDARIRPFAYTYRDYVIESFNIDRPFDEFVKQQIAADQLDLKRNAPELAAMGFLTLGRMFDNNIHDVIDDQIDVVSRGFLGLTASCSRCHDHKFDPIPTADYYSLYGVFASSREPLERPRIGPVPDDAKAHENEYNAKLDEIENVSRQHYKDSLSEARRHIPKYLVEVATTEPDYAETAVFFLSLIPGQLRPYITHRWRELIAERAFPDDPIFGPWHDLMERYSAQEVTKEKSSVNVSDHTTTWRERKIDARIIAELESSNPQTPKQLAEAYGKVFLTIGNKRETLTEQLAKISAELGAVDSNALSISDIVSGGNGLQTGKKGNGIDPNTGKSTSGETGFIEIKQHDKFIPVAHSAFIDGVFIPKSNEMTITSTGINIDNVHSSTGQTWDYFKDGFSSGTNSNSIGKVNFSVAPNTVLALHANKGITFDIQAMREEHQFKTARFKGLFGNSGQAGQGNLNVQIFLDGKQVFERKNVATQSAGIPLDIPLANDQRFLTIITTEGGKGISHDQAIIGNPRILMEGRDANQSQRQSEKLAKLRVEKTRLEKELKSVQVLSSDPIAKLVVGEESPSWFPKTQADRYLARQKKDAFRGLVGQLDGISIRHKNAAPRAMLMVDKKELFDPVIFQRGDPGQKGNPVPRRFFDVLSGNDKGKQRKPFANGSGRLELANAIASPDNPLTARVWVNRIWMHHFGEPLVANPSDFGLRTKKPVHLDVLDFLASRFIEGGWRTKPIHKLIMTSEAYQRSSKLDPKFKSQSIADPNNDFYWKANRRRLDLEQMRDSMLFVSGQLDLTQFGRPSLITDPANRRRTVYAFVERQNLPAIVGTFDFATADTSVARRVNTTVPQQALFAMNSPFVMAQAVSLAKKVEKQNDDKTKRIHDLYQAVFSREPQENEVELGLKYLESNSLTDFAHVLLMTNEFMFID